MKPCFCFSRVLKFEEIVALKLHRKPQQPKTQGRWTSRNSGKKPHIYIWEIRGVSWHLNTSKCKCESVPSYRSEILKRFALWLLVGFFLTKVAECEQMWVQRLLMNQHNGLRTPYSCISRHTIHMKHEDIYSQFRSLLDIYKTPPRGFLYNYVLRSKSNS